MAFLDSLETDAQFINERLVAGESRKDVEWDIDSLKGRLALCNRAERKEFKELVQQKYPKTAKLLRW